MLLLVQLIFHDKAKVQLLLMSVFVTLALVITVQLRLVHVLADPESNPNAVIDTHRIPLTKIIIMNLSVLLQLFITHIKKIKNNLKMSRN